MNVSDHPVLTLLCHQTKKWCIFHVRMSSAHDTCSTIHRFRGGTRSSTSWACSAPRSNTVSPVTVTCFFLFVIFLLVFLLLLFSLLLLSFRLLCSAIIFSGISKLGSQASQPSWPPSSTLTICLRAPTFLTAFPHVPLTSGASEDLNLALQQS